jgi:biopolymer transport protein ExbD
MKHQSRLIRASRSISTVDSINMTPLIDLAFALLIIFIIATPLLEQTIPLNLPLESQSANPQPDKTRFQVLSIDRSGQVFWGNQAIDLESLDSYLERLSREIDPPVINLRADASLPYQRVIDVIDRIKKANLEKISLDTQVK